MAGLVVEAGAVDQTLRPQDYRGLSLGGAAEYGKVMASSGDWLAVGAPGAGFNHFESTYPNQDYTQGGRVMLWKRDAGVWKLRQALTWPNSNINNYRFGSRLAMDGDRLLVGDGTNSGRIHAYKLEADVWSADGTLNAIADGNSGFTLNGAIAISGDYAAVGSPDGNVNGAPKGGVDLFQRQHHGWVRLARLTDLGVMVQNLGRFLALRGSTVYVSYTDGAPEYGGVMVFEKTADRWLKTRVLADIPKIRHGGIELQVSGDRLFAGTTSVEAPKRVQEFAFTPETGVEVLVTQVQISESVPWHVSGDLMLVRSGRDTCRVFRRQSNPVWEEEASLGYDLHRLMQPFNAIQVVGGELFITGRKFIENYSVHPQAIAECVQVMSLQQGSWKVLDTLLPLAAERVKDGEFGRGLAASDQWVVVGSPCMNNAPSRRTGLTFIYRRGPNSTFQFHSLLPDPVVPAIPYLDLAHFGTSVAAAGNWVAVSLNRPEPQYGYSGNPTFITSCVVLYAYDVSTDAWVQKAVLQAPTSGHSNEGFGYAMAMQGERLAVGVPGGRYVCLYDMSSGLPVLESTLMRPDAAEVFGKSVALDGTNLLVGAPSSAGGSAYFYEKKATGWTLNTKLVSGSFASEWRFGQTVALAGNNAMVGVNHKGPGLPVVRTGNVWKAQKPLTHEYYGEAPVGTAMSGSLAVFSDRQPYFPLSVYGLQNGVWARIPQAVPAISGGGSSVVIHEGQLLARALREVRVMDLNRRPAVTFASPVFIESQQGNTWTLDAGEYVPDVEVKPFAGVTLTHQGAATTKVNIEVASGEGELTLKTNPITLLPGQSQVLDLAFLPRTTGQKTLTLTLSPDTPNTPPQVYVFRAMVLAIPNQLQFIQRPEAQFVNRGDGNMAELAAGVSGTLPWSFRWLKNGKFIPGATSALLRTKDAGLYQVEVTNPYGSIQTDPVPVGFWDLKTDHEQIILVGGNAKASVVVSGPGIKVRWGKDEGVDPGLVPLTDGPYVSGSQTPNLTVRNVQTTTTYIAYMTMPTGIAGQDDLLAEAGFQVEAAAPPEVAIQQHGPLIVGQEDGLSLGYEFSGSQFPPIFFRVSGLPPGMRATADGQILGAPTTTGVYTVSASVTVSGFTSSTKSARILVTKHSGVSPGSYWGWIEPSEDLPLGGAVVLDITPTSSFSGSMLLGMTRTPLAGALDPTKDFRSRDMAFPILLGGQRKVVYVQWAGPTVLGLMVRDPSTPFNPELPVTSISDIVLIKPLLSPAASAESLGRHNFGLLSRAGDGMAGPEGHGFGTLTVAADRRAGYTAQLADGTTLTGSTWLSVAENDPEAIEQVYFYQGDAKTRSHLRGAVRLRADDSEIHRDLDWQRLPGTGRTYPEGFGPVQLRVATSRYPAPGNAPSLPGTTHQVSLSADGVYVNPTPFRLTPQNRAVVGKGVENPLQLRLDVYAPTGLFTGQFTLRDEDPANPARTIPRAVQYRGVLLPEWESGVGFFLVPKLADPSAEPPTTLQTSPIVSGSVQVEAVVAP